MFNNRRLWITILLNFAGLLLYPQKPAEAGVLEFEGFPDGAIFTTQYQGLTFSNTIILSAGISLNEFELPPFSGQNVASDNGGPISISFDSPVLSFTAFFTYYEPLTLAAFDNLNNEVVHASSLFSINVACDPGPFCLGDPGSSPNEPLTVTVPGGISSVTITGDLGGGSFVMDDVVTTSGATVPELGSALSFISGAAIVVVLRRKPFMAHKSVVTGIATLLILCTTSIYAFQQSPSVVVFPAVPSTLYANTPTVVKIMAQVMDSRVISTGVNLLQIDPTTSQTVTVGMLHDDGKNGDALGGDGIFTITLQPATSSPALFTYEISAAFKGLLKRSVSLPITIAVAPMGVLLPPDPGPPGMQTLTGIDSDNDGVRDDVERWIAVSHVASAKTRAALMQEAVATQQMLLSSNSQSQALAASNAESNGLFCLAGVLNGSRPAGAMIDQLRPIVLNTIARTTAYLAAESVISGSAYTLPDIKARLTLCNFNPSALRN